MLLTWRNLDRRQMGKSSVVGRRAGSVGRKVELLLVEIPPDLVRHLLARGSRLLLGSFGGNRRLRRVGRGRVSAVDPVGVVAHAQALQSHPHTGAN
jgi:hypothetical protein